MRFPKPRANTKRRSNADDPNNPKPRRNLKALAGTPEMLAKSEEARLWWADPDNRKKTFDHISGLLIAGKGVREIRRSMRGVFPVGQCKIERIAKRIKEEWLLDDAENRKSLRTTHARRLLEEIDAARKAESWGPVFAGEAVYGKVTGTIIPEDIHIHVDRVDLIQRVMGGLDDTRLKELYERQLVREKMLQSAGLSMPVVREGAVIDIDPKDVQTEVESVLVERAVEDGGE